MLEVYSRLLRDAEEDNDPTRENFGDLIFADSGQAAPLQAADLLAYEAHRYAKKVAQDSKAPMRREYHRALSRFRSRDDFWLFDAPRFQNIERVLESTVKERLKDGQEINGV